MMAHDMSKDGLTIVVVDVPIDCSGSLEHYFQDNDVGGEVLMLRRCKHKEKDVMITFRDKESTNRALSKGIHTIGQYSLRVRAATCMSHCCKTCGDHEASNLPCPYCQPRPATVGDSDAGDSQNTWHETSAKELATSETWPVSSSLPSKSSVREVECERMIPLGRAPYKEFRGSSYDNSNHGKSSECSGEPFEIIHRQQLPQDYCPDTTDATDEKIRPHFNEFGQVTDVDVDDRTTTTTLIGDTDVLKIDREAHVVDNSQRNTTTESIDQFGGFEMVEPPPKSVELQNLDGGLTHTELLKTLQKSGEVEHLSLRGSQAIVTYKHNGAAFKAIQKAKVGNGDRQTEWQGVGMVRQEDFPRRCPFREAVGKVMSIPFIIRNEAKKIQRNVTKR